MHSICTRAPSDDRSECMRYFLREWFGGWSKKNKDRRVAHTKKISIVGDAPICWVTGRISNLVGI